MSQRRSVIGCLERQSKDRQSKQEVVDTVEEQCGPDSRLMVKGLDLYVIFAPF